MAQCHAKSTTSGEQCKKLAMMGQTVCGSHGGKSPQALAAAKMRILELIEPALAALAKTMISGESDSARVSAAKDILDRAGLGAVSKSQVDVSVYDTRDELLRKAQDILDANDRTTSQPQ